MRSPGEAAHAPAMRPGSRADPVTLALTSLHTGCSLLYTLSRPSQLRDRPQNHLIFTSSSGTCSPARQNRVCFLLLGTSSLLLARPVEPSSPRGTRGIFISRMELAIYTIYTIKTIYANMVGGANVLVKPPPPAGVGSTKLLGPFEFMLTSEWTHLSGSCLGGGLPVRIGPAPVSVEGS